MNRQTTYIWGLAADSSGIVQYRKVGGEEMPGGGLRAWQETETVMEPATAYASVHPAPMPMRWCHGENIGRVVALRRAHGNLYAVAECDLEPDDLQLLTREHGELRWSTGTMNRRREALRITEISLSPAPATVGLPAVKWWKLDVTKGNLPGWVKEDLARASKMEYRSRGELRVHEVGPPTATAVDAAEEYEQLGRDLGMLPGGYDHHRYRDPFTGEEVEVFCRLGQIVAVNGRPPRGRGGR